MPSPIYLVKFNGQVLPGYASDEDAPLAARLSAQSILGRDGGILSGRGMDIRTLDIRMRALSSLTNGTGLQHLNNCKDQWRAALAICSRAVGAAALYIGETDRYIMCDFEGSSAPLTAKDSKAISYALSFKGNPPWFIGAEVSSSTAVSGSGPLSLAIGDTRKTYPTITIPTGITHITLSHPSTGKSFTLSGSHAASIIVDCATLEITEGGYNAISYLQSSPDFGIYHVGAGTLTLSSSNVTGSGNVTLAMTPRLER
jgi:hypothetical protein